MIAAATELFGRYGFEGASTHAIARRAGVNQGLIRHHFGGKEGLFREVVREGLAALQTAVDNARRTPASERGALDAGVDASTATARLQRVLSDHASLVALVVHALLEPGPRRDGLLAELEEAFEAIRTFLTLELGPNAADRSVLPLYLGAHAASVCFGSASGAPVDRSREALRVSQLAALQRWATASPSAGSSGPWSLAAAIERRARRG